MQDYPSRTSGAVDWARKALCRVSAPPTSVRVSSQWSLLRVLRQSNLSDEMDDNEEKQPGIELQAFTFWPRKLRKTSIRTTGGTWDQTSLQMGSLTYK